MKIYIDAESLSPNPEDFYEFDSYVKENNIKFGGLNTQEEINKYDMIITRNNDLINKLKELGSKVIVKRTSRLISEEIIEYCKKKFDKFSSVDNVHTLKVVCKLIQK